METSNTEASERRRTRWRLGLPLAVLLASVLSMVPARALSVAGTAVGFPSVTLDGSDQNVAGATSAWQVDASGETGGWHLTVTSTDFSNGAQSIPATAFRMRLLDADITLVGGDPALPTSSLTSFAALSSTPLQIASAAVGEGNGVYDLTPQFQLDVPAETYAGTYTATLTIDVAAGP